MRAPASRPPGAARRLLAALGAAALALLVGLPLYRRAMSARELERSGGGFLEDDLESEAYRLFVFGGSTALGAPYADMVLGRERPYGDLGRIAARAFGGRLRGLPISVVNRARSARDSGAALNQARAALRYGHDFEHAAALVYCGNNEFLEFDKELDLRRKVGRRLFDEPLFPPQARAATLEAYERNLEEIVRLFREAGAEVVLSTVAVNLPEWEPNRSLLADPGHEPRVRALLEEGDAAAASGSDERAVALYRSALELEPEFAWTSWRLGLALRRLGRVDEARAAFEAACLFDGQPSRASTATNAVVRRVAERNGLPCIEAEALFAARSHDGLAGYELFWDNCHPRLEGHLALGLAFAAALGELLGEPLARPDLTAAELERELPVGPERQAAILGWETQYHYVQSFLVWTRERRLAEAQRLAELALGVAPDDAALLVNRGIVALLQDDVPGARAFWRRARAADPDVCAERLANPAVDQILEIAGIADPLGSE